ncbi:MAG: HsdM family class I SAM-dependent methyltransferase [Ktedonobacterales bacterium]
MAQRADRTRLVRSQTVPRLHAWCRGASSVSPKPATCEILCDPACGTGGFLLAAHDYIAHNYELDRDQKRFLKHETVHGWEIVDNTARLCVMNLFLHGIGDETATDPPIAVADSLKGDPGKRFQMVLTNPPFGRKSSVTYVNEEGREEKESSVVVRDDFWASTSNKQLNFVQHIKALLEVNGRAAVVVPDNVLFEGGAGEIVRRKLLHECDVHTLLRLPTGIFYAQGVKANVIFFDKRPGSPEPQTKRLWVYDLRTNQNFTLRTNPLTRAHLDDFVRCYNAVNRHERQESERFRAFDYADLIKRDKVSLDLFWLRDESLEGADALPAPEVLAASIMEDLQAALEQFAAIAEDVGNGGVGA